MIKTIANRDIPSFVLNNAGDAQGYGNMWTKYTPNGIYRGGYSVGVLFGHPMHKILKARANTITQVIYSYETPIAWLDGGTWFMPAIKYSPTSGKHQAHCSVLRPEIIPWDISIGEYMRVQNGLMRFEGRRDKLRSVPMTR